MKHTKRDKKGDSPLLVRRSRGAAMLLVLIAVGVATILALSFLATQGPTQAVARNIDRKAQARQIAESALEMAIDYVNEDATWRTDKTSGQWMSEASLDGGTFDLYGTDEADGDLSDDDSEPVQLVVIATFEGVTHRVSAVVTPGVQATGNRLLLVAGNGASPSSTDLNKKAMFESWGYVVTVIDDGASASVYDAAVMVNDVVFVSEEVYSGRVNTKLRDVTIGVVNDEAYLHDDFGFSSTNSRSGVSSDSIDLVDITHPITSGFSVGSLVFHNGPIKVRYITGSMPSGVTVLADVPGSGTNANFLAADVGDQLHYGPAAGRRVMFPATNDLNVNNLNSDGQTLLRRSIDWAAGQEGDEILLEEDFESPDVTPAQSVAKTSQVIPSGWLGANKGYRSKFRGIIDEGSGDFTDPVGEQAFAFRYTNSGVVTSPGVIGVLTEGKQYEISFDVAMDAHNSGTYYLAEWVVYDSGDDRGDLRTGRLGTLLADASGNSTTDGAYTTVTFTFTPDSVTHADSIGKDLALRFIGATYTAMIDNVKVVMGKPDGNSGAGQAGSVVWDEVD